MTRGFIDSYRVDGFATLPPNTVSGPWPAQVRDGDKPVKVAAIYLWQASMGSDPHFSARSESHTCGLRTWP